MTSRPGPGIQDSLQRRGSAAAPARGHLRRQPSKPVNNPQHVPPDCIDPSLEVDRRPAEEQLNRPRVLPSVKVKPASLDASQSLTDAVRPPPRGKPQLFFSNLASNAPDQPLLSPQSQTAPGAFNLPVPPRPGSSLPGGAIQRAGGIPGGTGVKTEVATKAQSCETPAPAILFPGGKTADLFTWTGNHPEDTLSEVLVKTGMTNKPQIMNETNTARPSLWTNLKNKSGLSTLSTLFVAVLEKRQSCGRLTTPNTFKPPPRLTLRDSTRETWLHDLANPTVGLRRLSRTIPHGITGKVLLDQCLNKNIPIPRAIWLAKCVGINEMRSHKRKGQAGTITWVRGWTSSVEQFLDSTISTIGQQDWKPRITYALQLATNLYKDHLLEDDHFLDWILRNTETCPLERLFLWLLVASVYWSDLSSSRRRGRRLAECLLNHAERLYAFEDGGQNKPILEFLENTMLRLLATSAPCLLLPKSWDRYHTVLNRLARKNANPNVARIVAELDRRNKRLACPSNHSNVRREDTSTHLIRLLDSVDYSDGVRIEQLASDCMEVQPDTGALVSTVLQWASSYYRDGPHRTYLATRLLRRWNHLGADVHDCILSYLRSRGADDGTDPRHVFKITAELVRSRTFSIGKYLQWLIATGSASRGSDLSQPAAWPLRLLTGIPLTGLPEQVVNLRRTLLRNTSYSAESEMQILHSARNTIQLQITGRNGMQVGKTYATDVDTASLSSTVRLELSIWLRSDVASNVEEYERVPTKDPGVEEAGPVCTISLQHFSLVRHYLEGFEDYPVLADVIGVVATSLDSGVLAAAADTIHYNLKAFSAIGAFQPLFEKVAMRYLAIRTIRFPERDLLLGLTDLARTAQADPQLLQSLTYDLSRYDQKHAVAACSPASDNVIDAVYTTGMDPSDEINHILASGTSMDQQLMTRVFNKIISNLEEQTSKGVPASENHSAWFYRLRCFDESAFDKITTDWLGARSLSGQLRLVSAALPPLVVSGCLVLSHAVEVCLEYLDKLKMHGGPGTLRLYAELLAALIPSDQSNLTYQSQDAYRFRLEQQKVCQDPAAILRVLKEIVQDSSEALDANLTTELQALLSSQRLRRILKQYALSNIQLLSRSLGIGDESAPRAQVTRVKVLLDGLLDPDHHLGLSEQTPEQQVVTVVQSTSNLSLPFSQLEIRHLFLNNALQAEDSVETISTAFLDAIKKAVEKDSAPWSELVSGLDGDLASKIREHAEREILNASSFLTGATASEAPSQGAEERAFLHKYLSIIDFTKSAGPSEDQSYNVSGLVERLKGIGEAFTKFSESAPRSVEGRDQLGTARLCLWLSALLRLALVHNPTPMSKAGGQPLLALLWSLRCLFTHSGLELYPMTAEYAFDVAVYLSDHLSDEGRQQLARADSARPADDPRCSFVFGTHPPSDGWLALTRPTTPSTISQAPSSPQTPHPQQSGMNQGQPSGPMPIQRTQSQQQQLHSSAQQRTFPQFPQQHTPQNKPLPQFQRMISTPGQGSPQTQLQQMQQMQQMQSLAQQRATQPSPVQQLSRQQQQQPQHQQQPPASPLSNMQKSTSGAGKASVEMRPSAFQLKRWEILPDSSGTATGNETAISLSLFGARRV